MTQAADDFDKPRAYTAEEITQEYLQFMQARVEYWSRQPNQTPLQMCEGVMFSILCMLDGSSTLPGTRVLVEPHPDDKQDSIDNGCNWYEPGTEINLTHELLHTLKAKP